MTFIWAVKFCILACMARASNWQGIVLFVYVSMFTAHRNNSQRYKAPVDDSCEESSVFSSDLETTSVADSEDDRKSRFVIKTKSPTLLKLDGSDSSK